MQRRKEIRTGRVHAAASNAPAGKSGNSPYRMDQWLAAQGFLPGYAFGGQYVRVRMPRPEDDFTRPPTLALREFGPRALCYAHKRRWDVHRTVPGAE